MAVSDRQTCKTQNPCKKKDLKVLRFPESDRELAQIPNQWDLTRQHVALNLNKFLSKEKTKQNTCSLNKHLAKQTKRGKGRGRCHAERTKRKNLRRFYLNALNALFLSCRDGECLLSHCCIHSSLRKHTDLISREKRWACRGYSVFVLHFSVFVRFSKV